MPSNLLMRRELRTRYSCVRPSMQSRKSAYVFYKNVHCSPRFTGGDPVFALNLSAGPRWVPWVIIDVLNRSYYVQVEQKVWKLHEDQLHKRSPLFETPSDPEPLPGSLAPDSTPAVMHSFPIPGPLSEPTTPPVPPPEPALPPSSSRAAPLPVVPPSPLAFVVTSVTDRDGHVAAQADSSLFNRRAWLSRSLTTYVSLDSPISICPPQKFTHKNGWNLDMFPGWHRAGKVDPY